MCHFNIVLSFQNWGEISAEHHFTHFSLISFAKEVIFINGLSSLAGGQRNAQVRMRLNPIP